MPSPPPGVQPPEMSNSITLIVTGFKTEAQKKDFGDKLQALLGKVSGGSHQVLTIDIGGRPNYQISTASRLDVQNFADQITWVQVTKVSGQTIELVVRP
jgi:hypothetical protein